MKAVPQDVQDQVKAVAPACLRRCCKPDVQIDVTTAKFSLACPNGTRFAPAALKCVDSDVGIGGLGGSNGTAKGAGGSKEKKPAGFAPCPPGTRVCPLSAWQRPLCAARGAVFGVDACALFEPLAMSHKLPKVACPPTAAAAAGGGGR
jgi:hypothetical protein